MNTYLIKFRATLTLVLALHTLSMQLAKYSLAKDLQEVLNVVMLGIAAFADQMDSLTISEEQIISLKSALELNQLKEHLLKIKGTVKRNIAFSEQQSGGELNGPRRRKESRNIHSQLQQVYDFLDLWFRQMLVSRTSAMLSQKQLNQIQLLSTTLLTKNQDKDCKYLQQLLTSGGNFNILSQFKSSYEKEDLCLRDTNTYIFTRVLSPVHQRAISCELDQIVEERFRSMGKSISMTYFFSNVEKFRYFGSTFEMKEKHEALKDLQLGISHQKSSSGTVDLQIQNSLFCTGIELFKQRQEPIVDICFDRSGQHDMMAMAIQAKGMREISVIDTLVYRNRRDGGLEMIDEDQMSWAECLHRYEPIQQVHSDLKPTTDSIKAALYGLYYHATVDQTTKQERLESAMLVDQESRTQQEWDGQPAANYLKTYSDLRITHDDYTNAIEAHPLLPIYLSGNAKGLVCMWSFNQMADKSLNQWMLDKDTPPNQANPKKATVKKIEFNSYGDKFAALNTGGQLFVMNFDLETSSKVEPLWSTLMAPKLSEIRLSDFSFLDRDSLVAGVSIREKVLNVYDTLLPPKHSLVQSHRTGPGGNLMQLCSDNRRILCFNGKPGYVTEYDLRKEGEVITNKLLAKEEISAVALSPDQQTLLLGQVDGIVKIFDIQVSQNAAQGTVLTEKEPSINAFTSYGRQSAVSKLRFHPVTGALFTASSVGCVKLLRTAI